jgi:hypothetical protein
MHPLPPPTRTPPHSTALPCHPCMKRVLTTCCAGAHAASALLQIAGPRVPETPTASCKPTLQSSPQACRHWLRAYTRRGCSLAYMLTQDSSHALAFQAAGGLQLVTQVRNSSSLHDVHSPKGQQFGIYADAGLFTCAGFPGSRWATTPAHCEKEGGLHVWSQQQFGMRSRSFFMWTGFPAADTFRSS